jgi:RNA polymerase sigma factor (sigma-70 family)
LAETFRLSKIVDHDKPGFGRMDHASIAILCRALIECLSVMLYIGDIDIPEAEWDCRKRLFILHELVNRTSFLTAINYEFDEGLKEKQLAYAKEKLSENTFFNTLPEKRRNRLLEGDEMYVEGRHEAMLKFGWGDVLTRGVYKYLSNQAHSLGDMRLDQVKIIARRIGVTETDVIYMNRRLGGDASLNAAIREDGEWQDWLVDESPDQETTLAASEEFDNRRKTLSDALTVLNKRERRIFETRRLAEEQIALVELAEEFGVSRERVRQIEVSAFAKVQNAVKHRVAAMATPAPLQVR